MKITICDDEKIFCQMIAEGCRDILKKMNIEYEEEIFLSGVDLLESEKEPEILFLDIDMPQMDGIEVAEKMCRLYPDCFIIFVTCHYDKVRLGYKVNAHRFLYKPIDLKELEEAIDTAVQKISEQKMLILDERGTDVFIRVKDITYIEAMGFGCAIYTRDSYHISKKTMDYYEKELKNEGFYKIHKQYFVSLGHITKITNESSVIIDEQKELPLSRRKKTELRNRMIEYVKRTAI